MNGQGTYTYSDGDKFEGEWKDDQWNGQGTYTWSDGKKYVGEWKEMKRSGQGTFTLPSGNKFEGEWKNNKPWNGTSIDEYGKIDYKVVNGKIKK